MKYFDWLKIKIGFFSLILLSLTCIFALISFHFFDSFACNAFILLFVSNKLSSITYLIEIQCVYVSIHQSRTEKRWRPTRTRWAARKNNLFLFGALHQNGVNCIDCLCTNQRLFFSWCWIHRMIFRQKRNFTSSLNWANISILFTWMSLHFCWWITFVVQMKKYGVVKADFTFVGNPINLVFTCPLI